MSTELVPSSSAHEFSEVFAVLALQLRFTDFDEASIHAYFEALRDIPVKTLKRSGHNLANEPGRRFFPTTGEWRDAALRLEADDRRKFITGVHDWTVECTACNDCGWELFHCPGDATCGRERQHRPHDYVKPCSCRATNRTYQRHRAAEMQRGKAKD